MNDKRPESRDPARDLLAFAQGMIVTLVFVGFGLVTPEKVQTVAAEVMTWTVKTLTNLIQ